jgi:hypothetical protein
VILAVVIGLSVMKEAPGGVVHWGVSREEEHQQGWAR